MIDYIHLNIFIIFDEILTDSIIYIYFIQKIKVPFTLDYHDGATTLSCTITGSSNIYIESPNTPSTCTTSLFNLNLKPNYQFLHFYTLNVRFWWPGQQWCTLSTMDWFGCMSSLAAKKIVSSRHQNFNSATTAQCERIHIM